ncbi:permease [Pelosinus baikalensis]|uniref:Permease n=1 Tax=Pelosinus baikalensis TaxID=2892015 RepID=A0ABS8HS34_9FIRM|nr:permease [Pelosinus baikalensis]
MEDALATIAAAVWTDNWNHVINFKVILLSIVIESFPFLLMSVIVSALLNNFVSENTIRNMIPQSNIRSIFMACFLGILFPVCDCGMVPIVRRLILKGVPLPAAIAFMLAAPIVNPVVSAATAFAFQNNIHVVLLRLGTAFGVALCTGLLLNGFTKGRQLKSPSQIHGHSHGCCQHTLNSHHPGYSPLHRWINTLRDACHEFFEMGKYLVIGAMLGSLSQIAIPREMLLALGQDSSLSIGVMMVFAFFISVCSAADAFIAASFSSSFTLGSLVAFMVFGPMIDLKNILMLLHTFRTKFVCCLTLIIIMLCSSAAYLINHL